MHDTIVFRGSYQYATAEMLDRALLAVREHLESHELGKHVVWSECFSREHRTLFIHARLSEAMSGFFSHAVMPALSHTALHGAIEARRRGGKSHEYTFIENEPSPDPA